MDRVIKVGFCVAYDWYLLKNGLPLIYNYADVICISIDKDRISWAGNKYEIDNKAFYSFIENIDTDKKIIIYEDNFHLSELSNMQNEVRQRNLIAEKMGKGGWHIQLDTDEYFLNFEGFTKALKNIHDFPKGNEKPINVRAIWIPIIKKTENGYLYVDFEGKVGETFSVATNAPEYINGRNNSFFNILLPFYCIHQTQARSLEELNTKLINWGHADNELRNVEVRSSLLKLWNSMDEYNYNRIKNCHFTSPGIWPSLKYTKADNIYELIQNLEIPKFPYSDVQLKLKNSVNYSRLTKIFPFLQIK